MRTADNAGRMFGSYSIRPAAWAAITGRALSENRLLPGLAIAGMLFALYESIACGGAWRWLWPNLPIAFDAAAYVSYLLYFAMTIAFAREFLDLPATQRKLWRAIVTLYVVSATLDVLNVLAPNLADSSIVSGAPSRRARFGSHRSEGRRIDRHRARYGGEEFVAVLPYCSAAEAVAVADLVLAAVASLGIVHPQSPSHRLSLSAGIASSVPGAGTTAAQLILAADRAPYDAKRAGRNRVEVHAARVA